MYSTAIEDGDDDIHDREVWAAVSRHCYSKASDKASERVCCDILAFLRQYLHKRKRTSHGDVHPPDQADGLDWLITALLGKLNTNDADESTVGRLLLLLTSCLDWGDLLTTPSHPGPRNGLGIDCGCPPLRGLPCWLDSALDFHLDWGAAPPCLNTICHHAVKNGDYPQLQHPYCYLGTNYHQIDPGIFSGILPSTANYHNFPALLKSMIITHMADFATSMEQFQTLLPWKRFALLLNSLSWLHKLKGRVETSKFPLPPKGDVMPFPEDWVGEERLFPENWNITCARKPNLGDVGPRCQVFWGGWKVPAGVFVNHHLPVKLANILTKLAWPMFSPNSMSRIRTWRS
jgi:hypothetical protein